MARDLSEFIKISPGFKAAVNLRNERDNLSKVAGYIPTEVAREIILDFAKKLHPTTPDLRSRIIMGTYGTGKSHLALVLLNFFLRPVETQELQLVMGKLDIDTKDVLNRYRQAVPAGGRDRGPCRALERPPQVHRAGQKDHHLHGAEVPFHSR